MTSLDESRGLSVKIDLHGVLDASEAIPPLVMVVDDEVLLRLVAADGLREAGFQVVEACTADEAVTLLAAGLPCDLVFSDVNMPGSIDGIGLVAHVRKHHPTLPVVLTSGGVAADKLAQAGAVAIVPKPYSVDAVLETIGRVLGQGDE